MKTSNPSTKVEYLLSWTEEEDDGDMTAYSRSKKRYHSKTVSSLAQVCDLIKDTVKKKAFAHEFSIKKNITTQISLSRSEEKELKDELGPFLRW